MLRPTNQSQNLIDWSLAESLSLTHSTKFGSNPDSDQSQNPNEYSTALQRQTSQN